MMVLYSPQIHETDVIEYQFEGDKITVTYNGQVDEFDFTGTPDGRAISYGRDPSIISDLPIQPVLEVVRANGTLYVTLLNFIGHIASEEERFPEWKEV